MLKKIKIYYIDPKEDSKLIEVDYNTIGNNNWIYKLLDIDTFDMVGRFIGNKKFFIVCDDEGLFKANNQPAGFCNDFNELLFGKIFITKENEETGDLMSLTDEDIKIIEAHIDKRKGADMIFITAGTKIYMTRNCLIYSVYNK